MPVVLVELRKNIAGNQLFLLSLLCTTLMQIRVYFWNVCVWQPLQYGMLMSWIYYQMYCRLLSSCITISCCVLYSGLSDMKVVTLFITHVLQTFCHFVILKQNDSIQIQCERTVFVPTHVVLFIDVTMWPEIWPSF